MAEGGAEDTGEAIRSIHAIGSRGPGGAESFFSRLVAGLHRTGYPTLAVVRRRSHLARTLDPSVPRVEAGMRSGADVLTAWRIRRLLRRHRPEIVQTYLGRASRLTRVPRGSATVHVARLGGYYRPNAYRHADAWVGNTLGICDHLLRAGFPAERVFHVGNFVEAPGRPADPVARAEARARLGVPDDALLLFALGRFVPKKGFGDLLHAFARLPAEVGGRPLHLVVAGDGVLRAELEALGERLGVAARVRWTGWLPDPGAAFAAADLFVCPSREEPLGNVVLEAWGRGAPVVATRTAGPKELMVDGETGVLVEVGEPRALAEGILRVLRAPAAEVEAMVDAGLRRVRARHGEAAILAAYRELYADLAGRLGRRR